MPRLTSTGMTAIEKAADKPWQLCYVLAAGQPQLEARLSSRCPGNQALHATQSCDLAHPFPAPLSSSFRSFLSFPPLSSLRVEQTLAMTYRHGRGATAVRARSTESRRLQMSPWCLTRKRRRRRRQRS